MAHARRAFAMACAGFVNAFNPELIVIGGSIAEHQGDRLLGPARDEIRRGAFRVPGARVRLVPAELGRDVSLAGCQPLVGEPPRRRPMALRAGPARRTGAVHSLVTPSASTMGPRAGGPLI